jgi:hypothetical protein
MADRTSARTKSKAGEPPERYRTSKALRAAVVAWCTRELENGPWLPKERARPVENTIAELRGLQAYAQDAEARSLCRRLGTALREAQELLSRDAPDTYYRRQLRTVFLGAVGATERDRAILAGADAYSITAVRGILAQKLRDALPIDSEVSSRSLLVETLDTPRRCDLDDWQIAIRSLLAGNGGDWAVMQVRRAEDPEIAGPWPSVADAVDAERNAIALTRKRVAEKVKALRAKARGRTQAMLDAVEAKKAEIGAAQTAPERVRLKRELRALKNPSMTRPPVGGAA